MDGDGSSSSQSFGIRSSLCLSNGPKSRELRHRFMLSPSSGEIKVSRRTCRMARSGIRHFKLSRGFNVDDCDSRVCARILPGHHRQGQVGSYMKEATTTRCNLYYYICFGALHFSMNARDLFLFWGKEKREVHITPLNFSLGLIYTPNSNTV